MIFGSYRQYDSRWGKKNYNGSSNYATAACGPTSCANILYAINHKITPVTAKDVKQVDKMADVFDLMSKGYVGVFLFKAGTRGGCTWTTSGHYVAVTGYKHANGKHYIRTFDSGGRRHDGFFCYETQMKGLIPRIWLCKLPTPKPITKPAGKYTGEIAKPKLKKGSKGKQVKNLQKFLNWYHPAWKVHVDGKFGKNTEKVVKAWQKAEKIGVDGVYGNNSYKHANAYKYVTPKKPAPKPTPKPTTKQQKLIAKMKELAWAYGTAKSKYAYKTGSPKAVCKKALKRYGWADNKAEMSDCGNNVSATVREAGVSKSFKALHGTKTPFPKSEKDFNIVLKGKKIPSGFLKPADIVRYKKQNGNQHALFYFGDGKVCEASHHNRFFAIVKDEKKYNNSKIAKISTIQVLRVKE